MFGVTMRSLEVIPMKLVDSASMAEIDRRAEVEFGMPSLLLMESAGIKGYAELLKYMPDPVAPIVFLAGPGNNGGDSRVMARQAICEGRNACVVSISDRIGELPALEQNVLNRMGVRTYSYGSQKASEAIQRAQLIVDGLYGTGIRPPLRPDVITCVDEVNAVDAMVISIDIPSGIGEGFLPHHPSIRADATLTIALPKRALYLPAARSRCGRIERIVIGFPPELIRTNEGDDELVDDHTTKPLIPVVDGAAHKGLRGRVGVFGGATGTTGAPVLAASAAARSGSGLVYLNVDRDIYPVVASQLRSVMVRVIPIDPEPRSTAVYDAIVVGPGWGTEGRDGQLDMILESGAGGVLDADAINLIAARDARPNLGVRWVLTPHVGEMARLLNCSVADVLADPYSAIDDVARSLRAVVVLKSHITYIGEPAGRVRVVDGMNPRLATGGSGDVLAGMIAGLMARGASPFDAASCGAYLHSQVGRRAAESGWFLAEDLLPIVSSVVADADGKTYA